MGRGIGGPLLLLLLAVAGTSAAAPGDPRTTSGWIDALDHPDPGVRLRAADELGRSRAPEALVPLLLALRDERSEVRAHAAEALRALGDERAVPFLARRLEDPFPLVRCRAVLALGKLAGTYVLPTLERCLRDPAAVVRAAAVRALGEIGDPLSLDDVLAARRAEGADPDHAVRAAALVAAARIAGGAGLDAASEGLDADLAGSWFLRATAAHAAGITGEQERVPVLVAMLRRDPDPRVCQAASGALASLGAGPELLGALDCEDPHRRQAAVMGLATLGGEPARGGLLRAARDESPGVVLCAAAALLARGEREAIPLLIALLDGDAPVWLGALEVLELRTGRDFGRNPPRWKRWYAEVREGLAYDPRTGTYAAGR